MQYSFLFGRDASADAPKGFPVALWEPSALALSVVFFFAIRGHTRRRVPTTIIIKPQGKKGRPKVSKGRPESPLVHPQMHPCQAIRPLSNKKEAKGSIAKKAPRARRGRKGHRNALPFVVGVQNKAGRFLPRLYFVSIGITSRSRQSGQKPRGRSRRYQQASCG